MSMGVDKLYINFIYMTMHHDQQTLNIIIVYTCFEDFGRPCLKGKRWKHDMVAADVINIYHAENMVSFCSKVNVCMYQFHHVTVKNWIWQSTLTYIIQYRCISLHHMTKSLHGRRGKRQASCHNSLIKPDFWGAGWTKMGYLGARGCFRFQRYQIIWPHRLLMPKVDQHELRKMVFDHEITGI